MAQFTTWKVTAVNRTKASWPTTLLSTGSRMRLRTKKDSDKEPHLAAIKATHKTTITDLQDDKEG
jgi:hypothetical protein